VYRPVERAAACAAQGEWSSGVCVADEVVGRGVELGTAEPFLERAAGGLAALIFDGEAGIGKSTVWDAAADHARARGWLVLASRPAPSEQSLTLGGLTDLLGGLDDAALAGLPDPQRRALEIALLRVEPRGTAPDQRTLSVAVSGLLRLLARPDRPVLLAIDDAQWLDDSSASILGYAIRRLVDRPVGLLLAIRTGAETAASGALLAAVSPDRTERVRVGPLHLAELHRLFQVRLGRSFPRIVLLRIETASAGNPLYALEVGRSLIRTGVEVEPQGPLPVPDSLGSLIAGRVAALPDATRAAMLLAAAAAEPTPATLERAAPGAIEALGPAVADHLVEIGGDAVRFVHPLFAQAVTSNAAPARVRAAHAALAAATPSPDARARHLALAAEGPDEPVAAALTVAAADARMRGATLDAAGLYREANRLTPADRGDAALDRGLAAAECLFIDLSEYVDADRILEAAIAAAPRGHRRADALSLRAIIRYYHGRVPEAVTLAEAALAEAGDDPLDRARVLGRLAYLVMQLDLSRGVALVDDAVTLLEAATPDGSVDPNTLANALLLRANGELGLVRPTRTAEIERGLALITDATRSWEKEGADGNAFGLARHTDDLDRAIAMTRETIRSKSGPGGDDPFNVVMLSGLLLLRGEWAEARQRAEEAIDAYRREGAEVHPAWGLRGLALVAAHDGRLEDARRWAEEGAGRAADRGDLVVTIFHRHILGFAALTTEGWPEADAHLTAAATLAETTGVRHPGRFKLAGDRVEVALALGDVARAESVLADLDEAARVAPTPWVLAIGARCAALIAAARGDSDTAIACFDRAIALHEALPMPFERARTLLEKGRLHRRRKEKRLADETLREAVAIFEALPAPDWAARARAELGRVGRRPRAPESLTDTELRVAELAATGLSNREVAERAFLAPKTVGNVLGRVYEKLGIHSRAELGALMASGAAPAGSEGPEAVEEPGRH
jgi:DNA-binding CsgD family transcriptional regulator